MGFGLYIPSKKSPLVLATNGGVWQDQTDVHDWANAWFFIEQIFWKYSSSKELG